MAQDIVPTSAILSPDAQRGKAVGSVMTGLLIGILLSRVVSGMVTEIVGWRAMYQIAACSIISITIVYWRVLPNITPHTDMRYSTLMGSMFLLWRRHAVLRRAAVHQP